MRKIIRAFCATFTLFLAAACGSEVYFYPQGEWCKNNPPTAFSSSSPSGGEKTLFIPANEDDAEFLRLNLITCKAARMDFVELFFEKQDLDENQIEILNDNDGLINHKGDPSLTDFQMWMPHLDREWSPIADGQFDQITLHESTGFVDFVVDLNLPEAVSMFFKVTLDTSDRVRSEIESYNISASAVFTFEDGETAWVEPLVSRAQLVINEAGEVEFLELPPREADPINILLE